MVDVKVGLLDRLGAELTDPSVTLGDGEAINSVNRTIAKLGGATA